MTKTIGVPRCVTADRRTRAIAHPTIHVQASIAQRSSGVRYTPSIVATANQPTRNGQRTVRYQAIPEEMS